MCLSLTWGKVIPFNNYFALISHTILHYYLSNWFVSVPFHWSVRRCIIVLSGCLKLVKHCVDTTENDLLQRIKSDYDLCSIGVRFIRTEFYCIGQNCINIFLSTTQKCKWEWCIFTLPVRWSREVMFCFQAQITLCQTWKGTNKADKKVWYEDENFL